MKVLIIGANGQIGKHVIEQLQNHHSIQAKAMIRTEEQKSFYEECQIDYVLCNLESDVSEIVAAAKDCDAIVFTAGSGPHTGKDKTLTVDLDGAIKSIEAAEIANVKRYIMISSFDTTREAVQAASDGFAPYIIAKRYADIWLRSSTLDYTIIHPGKLTNEKGTGKVTLAEKVHRGEIAREDVATVIVEVLENKEMIKKEFQIVAGEMPIHQAIERI